MVAADLSPAFRALAAVTIAQAIGAGGLVAPPASELAELARADPELGCALGALGLAVGGLGTQVVIVDIYGDRAHHRRGNGLDVKFTSHVGPNLHQQGRNPRYAWNREVLFWTWQEWERAKRNVRALGPVGTWVLEDNHIHVVADDEEFMPPDAYAYRGQTNYEGDKRLLEMFKTYGYPGWSQPTIPIRSLF